MWNWLSQLNPQSILDFFGKVVDFIVGFLTSEQLQRETQLQKEASDNEKALQANIAASRLTNDQLADSLSKYTLDGRPTVFEPTGPANKTDSSTT